MKQIDNVLLADEGMTLTNGEAFGKTVYLGHGADASQWIEITDEEAELRIYETEEDQTKVKARAYDTIVGGKE
jgi:hypothetical protein